MEKRIDATKRIILAAATCVALASCGSLQPDEVVIAGSPTGQTITIPESSDGGNNDGGDTDDGNADDGDAEQIGDAPAIDAPSTTEPESSAGEPAPTEAPSTTEAPATTEPTTTEAPATEATTTSEAAIAAPSSTTATGDSADSADGEVAVLGAAQVQDDDDEDGAVQELPRTGANEVMLLIAIGCAMIVGGRSLIDLVNAIARAIQRSVPPRPAPPR